MLTKILKYSHTPIHVWTISVVLFAAVVVIVLNCKLLPNWRPQSSFFFLILILQPASLSGSWSDEWKKKRIHWSHVNCKKKYILRWCLILLLLVPHALKVKLMNEFVLLHTYCIVYVYVYPHVYTLISVIVCEHVKCRVCTVCYIFKVHPPFAVKTCCCCCHCRLNCLFFLLFLIFFFGATSSPRATYAHCTVLLYSKYSLCFNQVELKSSELI